MSLKTNYIKQLDGLRAVAVILVIIHHWFSEKNLIHIYTSFFNGVDIFFVLSGFLITRILINNSIQAEENGTSKGTLMKNFFVRRSLRIFPIYFLLLTFIILFSTKINKGNFIYFFTYTANLYYFERQQWGGMLSHLWSLSVEEQFYFFWPWLILFLNKKYILSMIMIFIIIGLVSQFYLRHLGMGSIFTSSCFDGLGLGALMAWIVVHRPFLIKKYYQVLSIFTVICVGLLFDRVIGSGLFFLPPRTLTSICTLWIISWVILNGDNKISYFNLFLNHKYLIFIGKISYGIYLYHLVIPYLTKDVLNSINSHLPGFIFNNYILIAENFILLIFISYLSWIFIEQPILKLKNKFEYQKHTQTAILPALVAPPPSTEKQ